MKLCGFGKQHQDSYEGEWREATHICTNSTNDKKIHGLSFEDEGPFYRCDQHAQPCCKRFTPNANEGTKALLGHDTVLQSGNGEIFKTIDLKFEGGAEELVPGETLRVRLRTEELVLQSDYSPTRKIIEIRQPGATHVSSSSSKILDTKRIECSTEEAVQIYFQLQKLLMGLKEI